MGIFAQSDHRAQAWQFVRYLYEPSVQHELYQAGLETQDAYLPPNMKSWETLPMQPDMKAILQEQANDAKGPPAVPGWTETTQLLEAAIQKVILKGATPADELAVVNQAMNAGLKEKP